MSKHLHLCRICCSIYCVFMSLFICSCCLAGNTSNWKEILSLQIDYRNALSLDENDENIVNSNALDTLLYFRDYIHKKYPEMPYLPIYLSIVDVRLLKAEVNATDNKSALQQKGSLRQKDMESHISRQIPLVSANKVPVIEALRFYCQGSGLTLTITDNGILIYVNAK